MKEIMNALEKIEASEKIRILYACETGSRAWGFPSPDSDYDVRFIYIRERNWYLSLGKRKDTLEQMAGDLDITGWDLDKSLLLLSRSNAALIERFQSPVFYKKDELFYSEMRTLVERNYSPIAVFFHHYALAGNLWKEMENKEEISLKKYFYVIRSLMSCYWAMKTSELMPMHLEGLMSIWNDETKAMLRDLVRIKSGVKEGYLYRPGKRETDWITQLWKEVEEGKENLATRKGDFKELNDFFTGTINKNADH